MKSNRHLAALLGLALLTTLFSGGVSDVRAASAWQDRLSDEHRIDLFGFLEIRNGWFTDNDLPSGVIDKDFSIAEARFQLDLTKDFDWGVFKLKTDLLGDLVEEKALVDLREANLAFSPLDAMDLKLGRQVLTWGTGDLLFINDLFPKDWVSFFIGRDDEYLKAPSDAVKVSLFSGPANVDLVYVPVFNGSEFIDGSRLAYWNPILGRTAGEDFIFDDQDRVRVFSEAEYAARLSRNLGGVEFALYGYYGFWKTPEGLDPVKLMLVYPRMAAYGASLRGPLLGGIANLEGGYYDSLEDQSGEDPFIRNSEIRVLAGFERELARDFTGGLQYYLEYIQDYEQYERFLPPGMPMADKERHLITLRLTKLLLNQNLRLSLFAYYSPSDEDSYLRPKVHYKITDQWAVDLGGNIFLGKEDHTFFGQFEEDSNVYAGLRWNF